MIKFIVPEGWPCRLAEAPNGMFVTLENPNLICFKSEYYFENGRVKAFNSAGEYFHGSDDNRIVQPVRLEVENEGI